ncbi:MAG TPA: VanZ family protein [Candidatus Faecimonas intestinavium]|nr:VanZ family protein [Candidatus Faecimonas intestinavium]
MDCKKVGQLIKKKRLEKKMTQQELADKLHITDRAISKWERGLGAPDISLLQDLSNILGLSISDVLSGEEHKESLSIPDKIIIILCLLIPIIIICFSLMISCFRTDYIFIGSIFLLIAYLLFIKKENNQKLKKNITWILFILYIIFLLSTIVYTKLTTGAIYPELNIKSNLVPFTSIIETITLLLTKTQGFYYIFDYLILDIILFIPLGLFLPILFPKTKKIKNFILICLTISIIKELFQLLLNVGMFNIDDIILNLSGAIISYTIFKNLLSKYMV